MAEQSSERRFHGRSFVSFVVTLSFAVMAVSGVVLYLSPPGGRARATGWTLWGLSKQQWMVQHLASCGVFLLLGVVHLVLNWRVLWCYVRVRSVRGIRRRWELLAAVVLVAFAALGSAYDVPPWRWILDGSWHLRSYRKEAAGLRRGRGEDDLGGGRGQGLRDGTGPGRQGGPRGGGGFGQ